MTTQPVVLQQLFADRFKLLNCTIERRPEVAIVAFRRDRPTAAMSAEYRPLDERRRLHYLPEYLVTSQVKE